MNKVPLFHSHLCVGFDTWHKKLYVNERTYIYVRGSGPKDKFPF